MESSGRIIRSAGVRVIYLVHGTFVGDDSLGLLRNLSRVFPAAAEMLREFHKNALDKLARDAGNYTSDLAERFAASINTDTAAPEIEVRLFHWSSENHHIARAHGAVRLIDEIASAGMSKGDRVLLWGHSHAGNVFALITNLLAADRKTRRPFFKACRSYYRWPVSKSVDLPVWNRLRKWLDDADRRANFPQLDFVTFGTPIRYGWDTDGYAKLLHFVHHRPRQGLPPYRTYFPPSVDDVLRAEDGDYVQHWGIAGTNLTPNLIAWRTWIADVRLGRLLQGKIRRRDLWNRLALGQRVPDEGETLLVDYGPMDENITRHHAGHAIYTHADWLAFHATEVAKRLYASKTIEPPDTD